MLVLRVLGADKEILYVWSISTFNLTACDEKWLNKKLKKVNFPSISNFNLRLHSLSQNHFVPTPNHTKIMINHCCMRAKSMDHLHKNVLFSVSMQSQSSSMTIQSQAVIYTIGKVLLFYWWICHEMFFFCFGILKSTCVTYQLNLCNKCIQQKKWKKKMLNQIMLTLQQRYFVNLYELSKFQSVHLSNWKR